MLKLILTTGEDRTTGWPKSRPLQYRRHRLSSLRRLEITSQTIKNESDNLQETNICLGRKWPAFGPHKYSWPANSARKRHALVPQLLARPAARSPHFTNPPHLPTKFEVNRTTPSRVWQNSWIINEILSISPSWTGNGFLVSYLTFLQSLMSIRKLLSIFHGGPYGGP